MEVSVPKGRRLRTTKLTVHRTDQLHRIDRTLRDRIPITTPARTLIDLASVLDEESLESAVEDGLRRRSSTNDSCDSASTSSAEAAARVLGCCGAFSIGVAETPRSSRGSR
jgi:hypothetical protein